MREFLSREGAQQYARLSRAKRQLEPTHFYTSTALGDQ
jgi:hypothetical protein